MTYATLPPAVRKIAERVLTPKQLIAYKLSSNGMSEEKIALTLGISRRTVRGRLAESDMKIHRELEGEAA